MKKKMPAFLPLLIFNISPFLLSKVQLGLFAAITHHQCKHKTSNGPEFSQKPSRDHDDNTESIDLEKVFMLDFFGKEMEGKPESTRFDKRFTVCYSCIRSVFHLSQENNFIPKYISFIWSEHHQLDKSMSLTKTTSL